MKESSSLEEKLNVRRDYVYKTQVTAMLFERAHTTYQQKYERNMHAINIFTLFTSTSIFTAGLTDLFGNIDAKYAIIAASIFSVIMWAYSTSKNLPNCISSHDRSRRLWLFIYSFTDIDSYLLQNMSDEEFDMFRSHLNRLIILCNDSEPIIDKQYLLKEQDTLENLLKEEDETKQKQNTNTQYRTIKLKIKSNSSLNNKKRVSEVLCKRS